MRCRLVKRDTSCNSSITGNLVAKSIRENGLQARPYPQMGTLLPGTHGRLETGRGISGWRVR